MTRTFQRFAYLRVWPLGEEYGTDIYIPNTIQDIARYIQCHKKEGLKFCSIDNTLLFCWDKRLNYPDSLGLYFTRIESFLDKLEKALKTEPPIPPATFKRVSPVEDSCLCLYLQPEQGDDTFNFLSADTECSLAFEDFLQSLSLDSADFVCEVILMLTATYIGNYFPAPEQRFRFKGHDFTVTVTRDSNKTHCYFDMGRTA